MRTMLAFTIALLSSASLYGQTLSHSHMYDDGHGYGAHDHECGCGSCGSAGAQFAPRIVRLGSISLDVLCAGGCRDYGHHGPRPHLHQPGCLDRHHYLLQLNRLQDERRLVKAELQVFNERIAEYSRLNSYREHKPASPFFTTLQKAKLGALQAQNRLRELQRLEFELHRQHRLNSCSNKGRAPARHDGPPPSIKRNPTPELLPTPSAEPTTRTRVVDRRVQRIGAVPQ